MSLASLNYTATEVKLIVKIFKKLQEDSEKDSYLYKLAKDINASIPATSENLQKLKDKKIVRAIETRLPRGKRGPVRYYSLTPSGKDLAEAFLSNSVMVDLLTAHGILRRKLIK